MNRDDRRANNQTKLKHAIHIIKNTHWVPSNTPDEKIQKTARRMRDDMKKCSKDCCCNPRHSCHYKGKSKLTLQERKALEKFEKF